MERESVIIICHDSDTMGIIEGIYRNEGNEVSLQNESILYTEIGEGRTRDEMIALSEKRKDVSTWAIVSPGSTDYQRRYVTSFLNGGHSLIGVDIVYDICFSPQVDFLKAFDPDLIDKIKVELRDFYGKIDSVELNEDGIFVVDDNSDKEICVTLEIDGFDIEAEKIGSEIFVLDATLLGEEFDFTLCSEDMKEVDALLQSIFDHMGCCGGLNMFNRDLEI